MATLTIIKYRLESPTIAVNSTLSDALSVGGVFYNYVYDTYGEELSIGDIIQFDRAYTCIDKSVIYNYPYSISGEVGSLGLNLLSGSQRYYSLTNKAFTMNQISQSVAKYISARILIPYNVQQSELENFTITNNSSDGGFANILYLCLKDSDNSKLEDDSANFSTRSGVNDIPVIKSLVGGDYSSYDTTALSGLILSRTTNGVVVDMTKLSNAVGGAELIFRYQTVIGAYRDNIDEYKQFNENGVNYVEGDNNYRTCSYYSGSSTRNQYLYWGDVEEAPSGVAVDDIYRKSFKVSNHYPSIIGISMCLINTVDGSFGFEDYNDSDFNDYMGIATSIDLVVEEIITNNDYYVDISNSYTTIGDGSSNSPYNYKQMINLLNNDISIDDVSVNNLANRGDRVHIRGERKNGYYSDVDGLFYFRCANSVSLFGWGTYPIFYSDNDIKFDFGATVVINDMLFISRDGITTYDVSESITIKNCLVVSNNEVTFNVGNFTSYGTTIESDVITFSNVNSFNPKDTVFVSESSVIVNVPQSVSLGAFITYSNVNIITNMLISGTTGTVSHQRVTSLSRHIIFDNFSFYKDRNRMYFGNYGVPETSNLVDVTNHRVVNQYNYGLQFEPRKASGLYSFERDDVDVEDRSLGHIGAFYLGGDYTNFDSVGFASLSVLSTATVSINVSVVYARPTLYIGSFKNRPYKWYNNSSDSIIEFTGAPNKGYSPLDVTFSVVKAEKFGYVPQSYEWFFEFSGETDGVATKDMQIRHSYCGVLGQTFSVKLTVKFFRYSDGDIQYRSVLYTDYITTLGVDSVRYGVDRTINIEDYLPEYVHSSDILNVVRVFQEFLNTMYKGSMNIKQESIDVAPPIGITSSKEVRYYTCE